MTTNTKAWYSIRNTANDEAEIRIYDEIGGWGEHSPSAAGFCKALAEVKAKQITLRLSSPGGSAFQGITIYNALCAHAARIVVHIDGLCASIASVIAMAGDEIRMASNAFLMIHNAAVFAGGDAEELRKQASLLSALDRKIAETYAKRALKTIEEIQQLMSAETWFTADDAKAINLVDVIDGESSIAPQRAAACMKQYKKIPPAIQTMLAKGKTMAGMCKLPNGDTAEMDQEACLAAGGEYVDDGASTGEGGDSSQGDGLDAGTGGGAVPPPGNAAKASAPKAPKAPKAATISEAKALAPGAPASAILEWVESGKTPAQIVALDRDRLQKDNDQLREALKNASKPRGGGPAVSIAPASAATNLAATPNTDETMKAAWESDETLRRDFRNDFKNYVAWAKAVAAGQIKSAR